MTERKTDPDWEAAFAQLRATDPEAVPTPPEPDPGAVGRADHAASLSLALGLVAIPTVLVFGLGALVGLVAVVLGIRALGGETGRSGRAWAGIGSGLIAMLIVIAVLIWLASEPIGACPYC